MEADKLADVINRLLGRTSVIADWYCTGCRRKGKYRLRTTDDFHSSYKAANHLHGSNQDCDGGTKLRMQIYWRQEIYK